MFTKNALSITASRFTLVYKIVLYMLIISLLFGVIGYAILSPTLSPIAKEIKQLNIGDTLIDYFNSVFRGVIGNESVGDAQENIYYTALMDKIDAVKMILHNNIASLNVGLILFFVLLYLISVAYSLMHIPSATVIYNFMSSNCKYGFASCYFSEFKKSLIYSLASSTFLFFYVIIMFLFAFGIYKLLAMINGMMAIMIVYILIGILLSIRRTVFYAWLPAIVVDNKSVIEALKISFKFNKKHFWRTSLIYFSLYMVFTVVMFVGTLFTFGTGSIFIFSFNLVFFNVLDMVFYYHNAGHKYYKDQQTVVDPQRKYGNAVLENPLKVEEK